MHNTPAILAEECVELVHIIPMPPSIPDDTLRLIQEDTLVVTQRGLYGFEDRPIFDVREGLGALGQPIDSHDVLRLVVLLKERHGSQIPRGLA